MNFVDILRHAQFYRHDRVLLTLQIFVRKGRNVRKSTFLKFVNNVMRAKPFKGDKFMFIAKSF